MSDELNNIEKDYDGMRGAVHEEGKNGQNKAQEGNGKEEVYDGAI
jgi:hypothetical protein